MDKGPKGRFEKVEVEGVGALWIARARGEICGAAFGKGKREFLLKLPGGVLWTQRPGKALRKSGGVRKHGRRVVRLRALCGMKHRLYGGTPFQRRVWKAIASIPWGEVRSYAWVARKAGRPRAVRAAAAACGANPVPVVVPCHRVVASDGAIGGFSGGLAIKKKLLKLEGHRF